MDHPQQPAVVKELGAVGPDKAFPSVKPEHRDRSVAGQQLANLLARIIGVFRDVSLQVAAAVKAGLVVLGRHLRVVPIWNRVEESELEAGLPKCRRQLLERVPFPRGGLDHIVIRLARVKHAEAFVVLGGDHHVFHPRASHQLRPLLRIELRRTKLPRILCVKGIGQSCLLLNPLAVICLASPLAGGNRVQAPVDKQTELRIAEPGHALANWLAWSTGVEWRKWKQPPGEEKAAQSLDQAAPCSPY